jgi:hypothetical protein
LIVLATNARGRKLSDEATKALPLSATPTSGHVVKSAVQNGSALK